jgi:hypothetical protein
MTERDADRVKHTLTGSVDGTPVTVELVEDDVHDITLRATEVLVPYTPGTTNIRFNVRWGQEHFEKAIGEGLVRDIVLDDPAFDREYVVDAGPADVVRELLDAPTRARLLAGRYRIWTRKETLVVEKNEWIDDFAELHAIVDLTIDLVRRLEPAAARARERQRRTGDEAGYRAAKTDAEIDADRAADLADMVATDARRTKVQRERAMRSQRTFMICLVVVLALVLGVLAVSRNAILSNC